MDIESLREQACTCLALQYPELKDGAARLVDECLASARASFRDDFICRLSPQAWAKIAIIYVKNFIDTGSDASIGDIVAYVVRDAIQTSRMDMLTLDLSQKMAGRASEASRPTLRLVREP